MEGQDIIEGKAVLIVDDEPDVLDTLEDLLPMCRVEKASDFQSAKKCFSLVYSVTSAAPR